jgi:hypothetical protein
MVVISALRNVLKLDNQIEQHHNPIRHCAKGRKVKTGVEGFAPCRKAVDAGEYHQRI